MFSQYKKDKKFKVILYIFLSVAIIIIFCMIYFVTKNITNTEMQKAKSKTEYFMQINDSRMETAKNILVTMQNDSDVLKYITLNDRYHVLAINKKLKFFTAVENMFNFKLEIIDPQHGVYISSNEIKYGFTDLDDYTENQAFIKKDDYITEYFQRTYFESSDLIFSYKLYNDIGILLNKKDCDHYLTLYNGDIVYGYYENVPNIKNIEALGTKRGNNIFYNIISKNNPAFSYIYILNDYISMFTIIQLIVLSAFILFLAYALAILFYNFSLKKIADITSKVSQITDIPIADENADIDLIIDRLKKTFETLKEAQQTSLDNQPIILQKQLSDLYKCILPKNNIKKLLSDELKIITQDHTLVSIIIVNSPELEDEYTLDGILYIKKDIIDMICDKLTNVYYFADRTNGFTLLSAENSEEITAVITDLADVLLINFNIILKACIGHTVCGYNESIKSYNNIQHLISNILFRESDTVVFTESEHPSEESSCIYSIEIEQQIISRCIEGQFDSAKTIVENVIVENITSLSTKNALYTLKNALDITIRRIGEYFNIDVSNFIKNDINFNNMSVEQISFEFMQPFNKLVEFIRGLSAPTENDYSRIYNFISNNIHNDINLNDLSDHLGYSVWKTSRKFKELFNENFKTYVIKRKIEISKKLLIQDYSVADVATAIGCNSAATFIRMFKNIVGITPGEYKRSLTTED